MKTQHVKHKLTFPEIFASMCGEPKKISIDQNKIDQIIEFLKFIIANNDKISTDDKFSMTVTWLRADLE